MRPGGRRPLLRGMRPLALDHELVLDKLAFKTCFRNALEQIILGKNIMRPGGRRPLLRGMRPLSLKDELVCLTD